MVAFLFVCVCLLGVASSQEFQRVNLNITQGELRGLRVETTNGTTFYAFRSIPYAKPPIDDLRFKRPVPADSWEKVRDATGDPGACPQWIAALAFNMGQEDCLFINVFTPEFNSSRKREVMFHVHGGVYVIGSSSGFFHGPGKIMDYDVVLVTFNYRLGVLGFLSTGDEEAAGNFGLWDQVLALKWTYENIASFGGDPDRITVFGHHSSALLLRPELKGMYHRIITQSFSPACDLILATQPQEVAVNLSRQVGCATESSKKIVECLRGLDTDVLIDATKVLSAEAMFPLLFTPVLDTNYTSNSSFFTDHPQALLNRGEFIQVPTVTGFTKDEGGWYYFIAKQEFGNLDKTFIDNKLEAFLANVTHYEERGNKLLADGIRREYFNNTDWSDEVNVRETFVQALSDRNVRSCHRLYVDDLIKYNVTTYLYSFDYRGSFSLTDFMFKENIGISHGDDIQFFFDMPLVKPNKPPTEQDTLISARVLKLFTDFAITGKPNENMTDLVPVVWEPVRKDNFRFLRIDNNMTMDSDNNLNRASFWKDLIPLVVNASN